MPAIIREMMGKISADKDFDEETRARLVAALQKLDEELPEDASEDEQDKAAREAILEGDNPALRGDTPISPEDREYVERAYAAIEEVFEKEDWNHFLDPLRPDLIRFRLAFRYEGHIYWVSIYLGASPRHVRIDVAYDFTVEPARSYLMCEMIARWNYGMDLSGYFYDMDEGQLLLRSVYPTEDGIDGELFGAMLDALLTCAREDYDRFHRLAAGSLTREESSEAERRLKAMLEDLEDE